MRSGRRCLDNMGLEITDRGIWVQQDVFHYCDQPLCSAIINMFYEVETVIDIGCGNGEYTLNFLNAGINCKGFDGNPCTPTMTKGLCSVMDFSQPVDLGQYDLVLCLEVGEHIPAKYEQVLIDNICRSSKEYVVLSWGIEGQDGWGHVNCQNNDYVINEMNKRGFDYLPEKSQVLRDAASAYWFKNTTMIYVRK